MYRCIIATSLPREGSGKKSEDDREKLFSWSISSRSPLLAVSSGFAIVAPADEHYDAAPHDVESSPLFLDELGALSGEGAAPPSVGRILHERRRGRNGRAASRRSLFLGQLPLLVEVEGRHSLCTTRICRRSHGLQSKTE